MTPQAQLEADLSRAHYDNWGTDAEAEIGRRLADAQQASESTDQRCLRLGLRAADLDAEGERHMAAEGDAAGRAASRRLRQGEDDPFATSFDREAAACLACADRAFKEAEALRAEAAALRRAEEVVRIVLEAAE